MNEKLLSLLFFALLSLSVFSRTVVTVTESTLSVSSYTDKEIIVNGQTDLHLTSSTLPLDSSIVHINTEKSWLFFDNIRPADVISNWLQYVFVSDQQAVNQSNVRVAIYKNGTVVMPHSSSIRPLTVFEGQAFTGDSTTYLVNTKNTSLGTFDNTIRSFKLKRGYMATMASTSDGSGYSRVFIADEEDLRFSVLPTELDQAISFIRVFKWEYVSKKGWCGTGSGGMDDAETIDGTWYYTWSADQASTSNLEYVPIKQKSGWPGWTEINDKQNVTHLLGYNEPDQTSQANMTVAEAIALWPDYMNSGLRLGSPVGASTSWMYEFMEEADALNYRVDFVAVHAYWGGKTAQTWYNDLKYIHEQTGRPLWITEWNNGANWTTEWWPTDSLAGLQKQLDELPAILNVLDTAHFVERYSIYNWVEDKRAMLIDGVLTPAGEYYKSNPSEIAYSSENEVIPTFSYDMNPGLTLSMGSKTLTLTITDPNGEYARGFIVEKQLDDSSFTVFYQADDMSSKYCADTLDLTVANRIRYRVRTKLAGGTYSNYSDEVGFDISSGGDFQYGTVSLSNVNWNPIYFRQPYTSVPSIILGASTNKNSSVLLTPRSKLVSYTSRFNLQLAPWAYQNVTSLSNAETVPYFISKEGSHNLGGLKALAWKKAITANWTSITFSEAFDTIPIVFTSQLTSPTSYATTIRVRNVTKTGFEAKLQKESAITSTLSGETVSFFAITPGTGSVDNRKLIVGKTINNAIGSIYSSIVYGDSIANPIFIAQMQTCNDDTVTAVLRNLIVSNKYANVVKQREKSTGVTTMGKETGGWMVIDKDSYIPDGLKKANAETLTFYPNPAREVLYLSQSFPEGLTVEVYTISGTLVKRNTVFGNELPISDLPSGYYLLKSSKHKTTKFVKL